MKACVVGRSVPRLEDGPLVTGRGQFAADIAFAHMLHMRLARPPYAHGRIVAIDAQPARELRGVEAVWTFADVADIPPIDFRLTRIEGLAPYRQPILASNLVRYVGEPVAAVFAVDPYSLPSMITGRYNERLSPPERNARPLYHLLPPSGPQGREP